jgi:hypothetical protein
MLNSIETTKRGQGLGSQALDALCQIADDCRVTIDLDVGPGSSEDDDEADGEPLGFNDLVDWYERKGFRWYGDSGTMKREPVSESMLSEGRREISPELTAWLQRWVESSHQIEDQIRLFDQVREEASYLLNVSYPAIYRGLSISDADADRLASGESITIPAHRLSSWSKSRAIADDYALSGHGGEIGILIRKTGRQVSVVLDVNNVLRRFGRNILSGSAARDAAREKEVIVETDGSLTIQANDVIKYR